MNLAILILIWRFILFLIAATIEHWAPFTPQFPYSDVYLIPTGLPQWFWGWANFDGVHYLTIAKLGYSAQFTQAFFPLFPLFLRLVGIILRDKNLIISGITISLVSFYFSVKFFKKLLKLDYPDTVINRTILFLLLFPTSFYFGAIYTESIFFLLTIATFYFARKKSWILSGTFGALASATRITGIFLLPAILYEWYVQKQNRKSNSKNSIEKRQISAFIKTFLQLITNILASPILYLIPLGLFGYMLYLQIYFHDALYFWHAQGVFGAQRNGSVIILLPQVLWRYLKILTTVSIFSQAFGAAFWEFAAFIFSTVLLFLAHVKKVRPSYLLFSWMVILIPTLTGTLSSLPRYILMAFPIFITLGLVKNQVLQFIIAFFFAILLIFLSAHFIAGLWVA